MKKLLVPLLVAFILSHLACALSEGSISTSNDALDTLIAGDGLSGLDLPASEPSASFNLNELLKDGSNKGEVGYRIASTELALGPDSELDLLGIDKKKAYSRNSLDLVSSSATNFDRMLLGSIESEELSENNTLIASSYSASYTTVKLDSLCAKDMDNDGEGNLWIPSPGLGSDVGANLNNLLLERGAFEEFTKNDPSMAMTNDHEKSREENLNLIEDIYITSYAQSGLSHLCKYPESFAPTSVTITGISHDTPPEKSTKLENINYQYENGAVTDDKSANSVQGIDFEVLRDGRSFYSDLSTGHLDQLVKSSNGIGRADGYGRPKVNQNLDALIENGRSDDENIVPYQFGRWDAEEEAGDERGKYPKNYAVVVGINSYTDWSGLKSPVNDAREMSEMLEACGYNVLELTDETEIKPTKKNILSAALNDIRTEEIDGNIIFYFSGHGVRGDDDTFYLVPQDAKSDDLSSCISEQELKGYLRDLDNLAVIIDACNSGDLNIADEGQLVLTSSKKNEPSNERWFGSLSVFTYNLCRAIEEEMRLNGKISLSNCFYRARDDTIRWSNWRLMSQTPEMVDFTGGNYYIK